MHILVVDDDIPTVEVIRTSLHWDLLGIDRVETAYDYTEAQNKICASQPDIILCDIEMPRGSGLDLLRWLREEKRDCEFVFLTCHANFDYAKTALQYGAADYITKPFNITQTEATLSKVASQVRYHQELLQKSRAGQQWEEAHSLAQASFLRGLFMDGTLMTEIELNKRFQDLGLAVDALQPIHMVLAAAPQPRPFLLTGRMSSMREVPVELRAISKRYGGFEAVKSVSFSLMEGELCALIGENGAGKSTLIRLITGLSEPSSGTISMFGQTGRREIRSCRERLGYMSDLNASYPNLTARDNLVVRCIEWGLPTNRSIDGVLSTVGLGEAGGKKVKNFSMGMRRRLDLAIALLGDPELLILDEPTNGLDPMGIVEVRKILTHLNKDQGKTILVSSHNLEEMHKLATDYLFISHGRLIRRMTAPQLEKSCRGGFVLHVDDLERTRSVLGDETSHSFLPDGSVLMRYEEKKEGRGIAIEALSTAGVRVAEAYSHRKSLEEFYSELIGRESEL